MTAATRPFPRADQVGSLLRPPELARARERRKAGTLDAAALRAVEDDAIRAIVRRQEELGFSVVVDGEFRRENWWVDFIAALDGVQIRDGDPAQAFVTTDQHGHGESYVPKDVVTTGTIAARAPVMAPDYAFLARTTKVAAKVTLPSPSRLHFHGGRASVSREAYPDIEAFFADVVAVYRAEIAALEAAGCRYVQIDDPLLTYFISDRLRAAVRAAGEDPDARLARYVRLINDCIAARGAGTAVGVHVCRGNAKSGWIAEGGYERVAEAVLGGLQCDHLLLEYDDARSGDFAPLRHLRKGTRVTLGLVTTKRGDLEDVDLLKRRIDEAARYVTLDDLAISPQCGFASTVEGNLITPEHQWAKLDLVVRVAKDVWGTA
ncbi:MAG: 5-methyltetrahydropteroyltriglutamate--homocysteine S-methyltransferase [Burkholderiales bacterium]|nr:5-methyltetrahydropteroyltriglutamate--homocysteine S-methyltransferase [Burkholderiales bacterium]